MAQEAVFSDHALKLVCLFGFLRRQQRELLRENHEDKIKEKLRRKRMREAAAAEDESSDSDGGSDGGSDGADGEPGGPKKKSRDEAAASDAVAALTGGAPSLSPRGLPASSPLQTHRNHAPRPNLICGHGEAPGRCDTVPEGRPRRPP